MAMILAQHPEFIVRYLERMENATAEEQKAAINLFGSDPTTSIMTIEGDTARVSIIGPLSPGGPSPLARFFGFGGTSYAEIIEAAQTLKADDSITKVILEMDTPGGLVTQLDEAWQALADLAAVKSVSAENHGMIASAGMWLASAATEIVATSPTVETGSIGVKLVGYDDTAALKEWGYKKVTIISINAPNKAAGVDTKDGRDELQRQVNALERVFISRVAEGRGVSEQIVINDFGQGGMLIAQDPDPDHPDAITVGLVDRLIEGSASPRIANSDGGENEKMADHNRVQSSIDKSKLQRQKGQQGSASSSHEEKKQMTLKELLADNPGAQLEYDAAITAAQNEGESAGQKKIEVRINAAKPYLSADSAYPAAITDLATKVVAGEVDKTALIAAVAAVDATKESANSTAAAKESEKQGETKAQEHEQGSGKGVIENDADYNAALAKAKKNRGISEGS